MMKKILTVALCAAMLLSMAGVSYSADGGSTNSSSPTIQVLRRSQRRSSRLPASPSRTSRRI